MNVRTKHWTLKPHRNMRQHKVFLRHELLKYNSEKSTAKSSALENYISSANLSLSGCSSAEPDSVSVGACKFQMKKLYLQTVKKVDHLPEYLYCYDLIHGISPFQNSGSLVDIVPPLTTIPISSNVTHFQCFGISNKLYDIIMIYLSNLFFNFCF